MPGILDRDTNLTITVHLTSLPTQYSSQSSEPARFQLACGAGRQVLGWVAAASCARFAHIRCSLTLALSFHMRHSRGHLLQSRTLNIPEAGLTALHEQSIQQPDMKWQMHYSGKLMFVYDCHRKHFKSMMVCWK